MEYQGNLSKFSMSPIAAENFHITLSFLGNTKERTLEQVTDLFYPLSMSPFKIEIGAPIFFSKGKILALSITKGISELLELQSDIERQLNSITHFNLTKKNFKPHISLFRNIEEPIENLSQFQTSSMVDSISLMESVQSKKGVKYITIEEWYLRPKKSVKEQLLGC